MQEPKKPSDDTLSRSPQQSQIYQSPQNVWSSGNTVGPSQLSPAPYDYERKPPSATPLPVVPPLPFVHNHPVGHAPLKNRQLSLAGLIAMIIQPRQKLSSRPPETPWPNSLPALTPLQQYKDYVKFRINYYSKKASRQRLIHNILQTVILVGAALVSISIGFPHVPQWLPPLISGIVTIAAVIANYYKFGERSRDLYQSAENTQQEYNWFKSKRGPYKNLDEQQSFEMLQDRVDAIKREQFQRSFSFEEQKETRK